MGMKSLSTSVDSICTVSALVLSFHHQMIIQIGFFLILFFFFVYFTMTRNSSTCRTMHGHEHIPSSKNGSYYHSHYFLPRYHRHYRRSLRRRRCCSSSLLALCVLNRFKRHVHFYKIQNKLRSNRLIGKKKANISP